MSKSTEPSQKEERQPEEPKPIEVHNAWTIYGLAPNSRPLDEPLAVHSRPQNWGDPRWVYHRYRFEWLSAPDGKRYINNAHCWTDLDQQPGEYADLFAPLIAQILMPGTAPQLCGRDYLEQDDFWSGEWGEMPPFYDGPQDDWGDNE